MTKYLLLTHFFEFRRPCEYIKLLEHQKLQKILQTDRSFTFCFMFSIDKYADLMRFCFIK